jgi:dienelactone hydrolase
MKRIPVLAVLMCLCAAASAQPIDTRNIAPRTELHPIPSLTLSDEQFLKGDSNGRLVTVSGQFRIAPGQGRLPVVVLVHGSSGIGSNIDLWAREFQEMGVSSFAIDGFTGRGLVTVGQDQSQLGRLNLALDAYRSLEILAKHPRVDPQRIVLMGFSRGGQATLYAAVKRFHQLWNKSGTEFAAYIPFYPDCSTSYQGDTVLADKPIHIFHGTPDDYNPVASCKGFMGRLAATGRTIQLTEYPNAQHGFDSPLSPLAAMVSKGSQTVRNCTIREEAPGRLANAATGAVFTYMDACVERDPHVGHDPAATQAAIREVKAMLKGVFKL